MEKTKEKNDLILIGAGLFILLIIAGINHFRDEKKSPDIWYVEKGLEDHWARILREAEPPESFGEIRVWDGEAVPAGKGILIATKPRQQHGQVQVYYRLSYDLEYGGDILLAVDPWMVFCKHTDPELTLDRVYAETSDGGAISDGVLLIPGKDRASVRAWTARLIQSGPGAFPADANIWYEQENKLFNTGRFVNGAQTYNWQDVFYRLMSSETAWVYAPLSRVRRYPNFRKSILAAELFPEQDTERHSLQAALLWAVPLGSPEEQVKMGKTIAWLKKPETQTIIADNLDWIPADPYGKPYDPVSLHSHRNWLTAVYIYEVRE